MKKIHVNDGGENSISSKNDKFGVFVIQTLELAQPYVAMSQAKLVNFGLVSIGPWPVTHQIRFLIR